MKKVKVFLFTNEEILALVQCCVEAMPNSNLFEDARKSAMKKLREVFSLEYGEFRDKDDPLPAKPKAPVFFKCRQCGAAITSQEIDIHIASHRLGGQC